VKARFFELAERLGRELRAREMLLCEFSGERSDFVRFNRGKVRQAGSVEQAYVSLRLIRERRQASAMFALGRDGLEDARASLSQLRGIVEELPEDPWLLVNEVPCSTSSERRGALASPATVSARAARRSDARVPREFPAVHSDHKERSG